MKARAKKPLNIFSLSFMDCICCGFGAVILLFVLNRGTTVGAMGQIYETSQEEEDAMHEMRAEIMVNTLKAKVKRDLLKQEITKTQKKLQSVDQEVATLYNSVSEVVNRVPDLSQAATSVEGLSNQLHEAKQELEKKRNTPQPWNADLVGGIPADSEYVIFIIDTSGSMTDRKFRMLDTIKDKLRDVLAMYPEAKGFQILSSDGAYMLDKAMASSRVQAFNSQSILSMLTGGGPSIPPVRGGSAQAGRWVKPDRQGRQLIFDAFVEYVRMGVPCQSSPRRGLEEAFQSYSGGKEEISIFVFGDDWGDNLDRMVQLTQQKNANGQFRIHGVGFPSILKRNSNTDSDGAFKFANALRWLSSENGGAFIGISR
ncbi:hypothetical protein [Pelagicoccus mobilis]|uniref:VWA domain-containing protein n=1 Tax=Pelagicoccus mobilis TaxID=415221 RepID=A0A934VRZ7_9BACT|nr:hypothetical protein [Pelagicoccus mobilis]MBK1877999.1 hypothetical protein [Pelagicoccus mobilis]